MTAKVFAANLRKAMEEKNLSQKDLARWLHKRIWEGVDESATLAGHMRLPQFETVYQWVRTLCTRGIRYPRSHQIRARVGLIAGFLALPDSRDLWNEEPRPREREAKYIRRKVQQMIELAQGLHQQRTDDALNFVDILSRLTKLEMRVDVLWEAHI